MGAHRDARGTFARLQALRAGVWTDWSARNVRALRAVEGALTPESRALLQSFAGARPPGDRAGAGAAGGGHPPAVAGRGRGSGGDGGAGLDVRRWTSGRTGR